MTNQIGEYVSIPQGEDIEKVKAAFDEIAEAYAFIESKKALIKDIKAMLKKDYEMTSKSIALMSKLHTKDLGDRYFDENDEMQTLYETIFSVE